MTDTSSTAWAGRSTASAISRRRATISNMRRSCVPRIRRSTITSATPIGRPAASSRRTINGAARCNSARRRPTRKRSRASSARASTNREPRRAAADAASPAVPPADPLSMIRVSAPAKIDLYLHVVGRREDGYHELDSLVAFADIADVVTAQPAVGLSLAIDGPFAAALAGGAADNLVLRTASLLAARFGVTAGAALSLTKNLPVASGIGGGSSDAAAALRALQSLWNIATSPDELAALAARLGADVPVCLLARTAWLGGIGEVLAAAPNLPPVAIV